MRGDTTISRKPRGSRTILGLGLVLLALALAACSDDPAPADSGPTGAFPLTLIDDAGGALVLEAAPQRVVAVLPTVVDLVIDLGFDDRLVGVDDFSLDRVPLAASVGGNAFIYNIEAVAELEPDLVIVAVGGTEELAQQARELGFPVYAFNVPANLEEMFDQLRLMGAMFGDSETAASITAGLQTRFDDVIERVARVNTLRVYLEVDQSTPSQPFTVGPGSLHQQIIELSGGANVFAAADGPFPQVNWESIIHADPEVILLLNSKELADPLAFNPVSVDEVMERTGWNQISAVQSGQVIPLPPDLFNVGVRLLDALEQVAETLDEARIALAEAP